MWPKSGQGIGADSSLEPVSTVRTSAGLPVWTPPTDVLLADDGVVVRVELAGTEARDIQVRASDSELIVSGSRRDPIGTRPRRIDRMEIAFGPFERVIPLPALVVAENARAHLRGGLLEVILPLASARGVRTVAFAITVLSTER